MNINSKVLMYINKIEKGIDMPRRKKVFGYENIKKLLILKKQIKNKSLINLINKTIYKYINEINTKLIKNKKIIMNLKSEIENIKNKKEYKKEIIYSKYEIFKLICKKRRSIRNFKKEKIEINEIKKVLLCAKEYPSACNRNGVYVKYIENENEKKEILKIQKGNKGIDVPILIGIVSNTDAYDQENEEKASSFNAGLFTSYFILGLTSINYSSCILNWHVSKDENEKSKKILNLEKNEEINCLIIVGKENKKSKINPYKKVELK